ncbi:bifunctional diaminohydroxyphosphoribosylaminopyrimidine deaminase/5-amino-6-(5-phosphoribosylamino)uracil reductase RibD [Nitrosophilus alvini]|uniref:bifunctional diaminohydroxyphosphoribosylaminopyrimidine deaminase/5-amino-6-(5-phosphoribosylamino)uracil reductase RibD n=1 Tax=Nitrosophilus alvini TaxID=2714855 RepID=UPI001EFF92E4|nr:bifunctional diaminohydroxyphosphoribosylaminopyrimidine deaminase/5-amino-6-(5-phosphoribosylamino)uracil reductase RibD [Nitrosophilus alvini]
MSLAIEKAWKYQGLTFPNPAVGAVITDGNGKILSIEAHKEAGTPHAELLAIKSAFHILTGDKKILDINEAISLYEYILSQHDNIFKECTIYVTLEPCNHFGKTPPCADLIRELSFKRVVIGTKDPNPEAAGGIEKLESTVDVKTGIMEEEAKKLIEPFVTWQKETFVFFKLAQTLNGSIKGGIISSEESRKYVHKLREKIELIVIGGNTVRIDRPVLDCRLTGGRPPDVLIFSEKKDFDRNIPLFKVQGRKVFVDDSFEILNRYRYVMIEGGEGMIEAIKDIASWYLFFEAPVIRDISSYRGLLELEFLNIKKIGRDLMIWAKRVKNG